MAEQGPFKFLRACAGRLGPKLRPQENLHTAEGGYTRIPREPEGTLRGPIEGPKTKGRKSNEPLAEKKLSLDSRSRL